MALAYFDCFAGSGGDMIVAALLDAGADLEALRAQIARLGLEGVELSAERVRRGGMAGLHFRVHDRSSPLHGHEPHEHEGHDDHAHEDHGHDDHAHGEHAHDQPPHDHAHAHRGLDDILALIAGAALAPRAAERARRVFQRLAEAEAKVHGIAVQEVHFHEVGAVDSIVDIVGACVAMELLDVERVICSPIPVGSGRIRCEHGELPVPAPATAQLLIGVPTCGGDIAGEATTPTAAAVLTTLAESFGPMPAMRIAAIGCGAGTRDRPGLPNLLRVFLGEEGDDGQADSVVELSANIDDCTGEVLGSTIQRLLASGCLDAWATPAVMKKGRPAWVVSALCAPADVAEAEGILFAETTTFGIRRRTCSRRKLQRRHEMAETAFGPIRVKVGRLDGRDVTAAPEFEDCRRAAEAHGAPVKEVMAAAQAAYRQTASPAGQGLSGSPGASGQRTAEGAGT